MKGRRELLALVAVAFSSCNLGEHRRPANVSPKAIFVSGAKGGWWQVCTEDSADGKGVRCAIYNVEGGRVCEEVFLPTDRKPIRVSEVRIDKESGHNGPYWIRSEGGRTLVPESRFEELRRFLEKK